ncbi:MAG: DUF2304 family protein [Candidatus Nealsonbacteria bacterium]
MFFIQILIVALAVLVIGRIILSFKNKKLSLMGMLLWLGLWTALLVAVLSPQITTVLGNALGVWRGTDAVVYLSIVLIFYLIFRIFVKLEKIESDITIISRKIALRDENNNEIK